MRVPCMDIVDYLTSSPEYGTAIVSIMVPCAVDLSGRLLLLQEYRTAAAH